MNTARRDIEKRIQNADNNSVFVISDFAGCGSYDAVKQALSRMYREKKLIRVKKGVYAKYSYSTFLNRVRAVSPIKSAEALARNYGWTIVPAGDAALNALGLTTQVPSKYIFASDGPYRKVILDNDIALEFRSRTNKEIKGLSYKSALVLEALKALGKENVTDKTKKMLRMKLSEQDIKKLRIESSYSRKWLYSTVCEL